MLRFISLLLAIASAQAPATQDSPPGQTKEERFLREYFSSPRGYEKFFATKILPAAEALAEDSKVREWLLEEGTKRWFDGIGPNDVPIERFAEIASRCFPFGRDRARLVALLARPTTPRAWPHPALDSWLRGELAEATDPRALDRLLDAGVPGGAAEKADRYVFLLEIVGEAQISIVRDRYQSEVWPKVGPEGMAGLIARLRELARRPELERFHHSGTSEIVGIRKRLADRLFAAGPGRWPEVGDALGELAGASTEGPSHFFDRAAAELGTNPGRRGRPQAEVLLRLATLVGPESAFERLNARLNLAWFLWLDREGILRSLMETDHSGRVQTACFAVVRRFDGPETARDPGYTRVLGEFYGRLPGDTFEIVRRRAGDRSSSAFLLEDVRRDRFHLNPEHRARLGRDVMDRGGGLSPAWPDEGAPSRLSLAIDLYTGPAAAHVLDIAALRSHVGDQDLGADTEESALLGEILTSILVEVDKARDPEPVFQQAGTLVEHLEKCCRGRVDLSRSRPLTRLERAVANDVVRAIEALGAKSRDPAALGHFVGRLKLALRLRSLIQQLGHTPPWIDQAVEALRSRVFGLAEGRTGPVPRWDESSLRDRASHLREIDRPLRECLTGADDRDRVFQGLYLPLARVPGFLRALHAGGPDWPYRTWTARAATEEERHRRFVALFKDLGESDPLDAEDAIVDLARAYREMANPGRSAWEIEPDRNFAGTWGRNNLGVRVWRRLLADELPAVRGFWLLDSIAERAVSELVAERPGTDDGGYIDWTANLVTASEWQSYPFEDARNARIPAAGGLVPGKAADTPFAFRLRGLESSRKVDGRLRLLLAGRLATSLRGRSDATAERAARLVQVASIAILLPNDRDNLGGPAAQLEDARRLRQELYQALRQVLGLVGDRKTRVDVFRHMMLLNVANRDAAKLEPAFDRVVKEFASDRSLGDGLSAVLAEEVEVKGLLSSKSAGGPEAARVRFDHRLEAMRPEGWDKGVEPLERLGFLSKLRDLDGNRITALLLLRDDLRTIIAARDDGPALAKDLQRIERALIPLDQSVRFQSREFDPGLLLETRKAEPTPWWPALVLLGWFDADLQSAALARCDDARRRAADDAEMPRRADRIARMIFRLDEAVFVTLREVAARYRPDARAMLSFRYQQARRAMNFRILAESTEVRELSAESLAQDGFRGVLTLLRLASRGRPRSDEGVQQRLFGSLGDWLPEDLRRKDSIKDLNVDAVARLSAELAEAPWAPDSLKVGAEAFLKLGASDLLSGAGSPERVFHLAIEIGKRCRDAAPGGYRTFYEAAMLDTPSSDRGPARLSEPIIAALAAPYFDRGIPGQKACVEAMLRQWRALPSSGPKSSRIEGALRSDFGRVLAGLVKGRGRPDGTPYLWEPADQLRDGVEPLSKAPVGFFDLAKWWMKQGQVGDPPELRRLFAIEAGVESP